VSKFKYYVLIKAETTADMERDELGEILSEAYIDIVPDDDIESCDEGGNDITVHVEVLGLSTTEPQ
jgi:hypothetical protein